MTVFISFRHQILAANLNAALMLILLLIGSITSFTTSLNTTSFRDLQFEMPYFEQAATWAISPLADPVPSGNITTDCAPSPMLGGPGVLNFYPQTGVYEKTYENILIPHTSVFITLEFMFIEEWDSWSALNFFINEINTGWIDFSIATPNWSGDQCGALSLKGLGPFKVWLAATVTSSDNTISFKVQRQGSRQFAVRNINIALSNQTVSNIAGLSDFANGAGNGYFCMFTSGFGTYKQCECNLKQYYKTDADESSCESCHSSCETCYGDLESECLTCAEGYTYDGSVCVQCHSTCDTCFGTSADQCASCPGGSYLYPDSTCKSSCDGSYTARESGGFRYCDLPDTPDTSDTPNPPVENSDAADGETPTQESGNTTLCTELNTYNYGEVKNETLYFYPDDSVCKITCPSPYVVTSSNQNDRLCGLPLSQIDRNGVDYLESTGAIAGSVMTAGVTAMTALNPNNPSAISVAALSKMFEYTRQFDVTRSPRLELYYKSNRASPGTVKIGPELPEDVVAKITYHSLPSIFVKNNLHSSFLVNFFVGLQTLLIITTALLLLLGIEFLLKRKYIQCVDLCQKIILAVVSFLTTQFYGIIPDILFLGTLQFMAYSGGTGLTWFGFFLAIIFYLFAISLLPFHAKLLWTYQKIKAKAGSDEGENEMKEFKMKYKKAEVLYQDFKDLSFIQQSFLLFLAARATITGVIMSALYSYPGVQIVFNILMNILTIIYLSFKSPYKSLPTVFQQIVYELNFILVNICFLILAALDVNEGENDKLRALLGDVIINCIVASKFIPIITIAPKVIDVSCEALKVLKNRKKSKKNYELATESPLPSSLHRRETLTPDQDQSIIKEATGFEPAEKQHKWEENSRTPSGNMKPDTIQKSVKQEEVKIEFISRSCLGGEEGNEFDHEEMSPRQPVYVRETNIHKDEENPKTSKNEGMGLIMKVNVQEILPK